MATRRGRSGKTDEKPEMAALESLLGHRFQQLSLLELALTHRSMVYDDAAAQDEDLSDARRDNEQMEFLGDAVLGLLVAESFCRFFPASREGELTRLRASVVSRKHLGEVGQRLQLGRWLRVGRTVEQTGGRENAGLLSNAVEAVIAALYLDGGLEAAGQFVEEQILRAALPVLERSVAAGERFSGAIGDYKSELQEYLQGAGMGQPEYRLVEETGPAHQLTFRVGVWIEERPEPLAEGAGPNKKQAQQQAARLGMEKLRRERDQKEQRVEGHA